jgi:hypothetical protein
MRALPIITALFLGLGGCNVAQGAADLFARDQARTVINGVVAERFPGVNVTPVTDCVIDNASAQEIVSIARASITGVTPETTQTVIAITRRPETINCIINNGVGLLL